MLPKVTDMLLSNFLASSRFAKWSATSKGPMPSLILMGCSLQGCLDCHQHLIWGAQGAGGLQEGACGGVCGPVDDQQDRGGDGSGERTVLYVTSYRAQCLMGKVTRPVMVMTFSMVNFEVEIPWLVVLSIMATGLGLSFLVLSICRLERRIILNIL